MSLEDHRENFNRRWNISTDCTPEEAFKGFKRRMLNLHNNIDSLVTNEGHISFYQYYAIKPEFTRDHSAPITAKNFANPPQKTVTIINHLKKLQFLEFLQCIEVIHRLEKSKEYREDNLNEYLFKEISTSIQYSLGVTFHLGKDNKGYILFYKSGEKELDEKVVNKTLSFLDDNSNKHFEDALSMYFNGKHVESAEKLRRTLEEFLKYKLGNSRGLNNNIKELRLKLKNKGIDGSVRNIIFQNFNYLDKYYNDNSKHNSKNISENENEFLIYQTGVLINYINNELTLYK